MLWSKFCIIYPCFESKTPIFFAEFFGENILKIITSVPGSVLLDFRFLCGQPVAGWRSNIVLFVSNSRCQFGSFAWGFYEYSRQTWPSYIGRYVHLRIFGQFFIIINIIRNNNYNNIVNYSVRKNCPQICNWTCLRYIGTYPRNSLCIKIRWWTKWSCPTKRVDTYTYICRYIHIHTYAGTHESRPGHMTRYVCKENVRL
jgi:hypothetical protein